MMHLEIKAGIKKNLKNKLFILLNDPKTHFKIFKNILMILI